MGLAGPTPFPLHEWYPELRTGAASPLALPFTESASGGLTTRRGTATLALPFTESASGRKNMAGSASPTPLPLSFSVASGVRGVRGNATALSLPLTESSAGRKGGRSTATLALGLTESGAGRTARRGTATLPLGLTSSGAGKTARRGAGMPASLPLTELASGRRGAVGETAVLLLQLVVASAAGVKRGAGAPLEDVPLPLSGRPVEGVRMEWVFLSPTFDRRRRMAGRALFTTASYSLTVWRKDGVWHQDFGPSEHRLDGADPVYPGGRLTPLTDTARAELITAGYAANLTLQET